MRVFSKVMVAAAIVTVATAVPVAQAQSAGSSGFGSVDFGSSDGGETTEPTGVLELSRSTDLATGDTVTITGTGFKANYALYLAETIAKPATGYPSTYSQEIKVTTDAAGSFTAAIDVVSTFAGVDCLTTNCYIATFAAFPAIFTDRSQDVWAPISFASGTTGPVDPVDPEPTGPAVALSKTTGIAAAGESLHITGSGFSGAGSGIYVALAQDNKYSPTDASGFGAQKWVKATDMTAGSWAVDLTAVAQTASIDCLANTCSIYTFAAHGSPDRTQDTKTPVTFQ